ALAECYFLFLRDFKFHGGFADRFMRTIAKWLGFAQATPAPKVSSRFQLEKSRMFDNRNIHFLNSSLRNHSSVQSEFYFDNGFHQFFTFLTSLRSRRIADSPTTMIPSLMKYCQNNNGIFFAEEKDAIWKTSKKQTPDIFMDNWESSGLSL